MIAGNRLAEMEWKRVNEKKPSMRCKRWGMSGSERDFTDESDTWVGEMEGRARDGIDCEKGVQVESPLARRREDHKETDQKKRKCTMREE